MTDVELIEISVEVDGTCLLRGVDLRVARGGFVGLLGPNGSGKSTVLRTLYRSLRARGGQVLLDGTDIDRLDPRALARALAAVTQDTPVDLSVTAAEMVLLGRIPHQAAFAADTAEDWRCVDDCLARVGALGLSGRRWPTLSGGERQRVLVARALAQAGSVLVLDEITNHLDVRHAFDLLDVIAGTGLTTIAALHDLNLAARYCDEVVVLDGGRVVAAGPPDEVLVDEVVSPVFGVTVDRVAHPRTGGSHLVLSPIPSPPDLDLPMTTTRGTS